MRTNAPSGVRGRPWWSWCSTRAFQAHHLEPRRVAHRVAAVEQLKHWLNSSSTVSRAHARAKRPAAERGVVWVQLGQDAA